MTRKFSLDSKNKKIKNCANFSFTGKSRENLSLHG